MLGCNDLDKKNIAARVFTSSILLQMFCLADPPYDKSLQQLQSFLSGLVSEEKLEIRDGMYFLKK